MASSYIIAQVDLSANTDNAVWTADVDSVVTLYLANRTGGAVSLKIGLLPSGTGATSNPCWIEYGTALDGNCSIRNGGILLGAGDKIIVNPAAVGISANIVRAKI